MGIGTLKIHKITNDHRPWCGINYNTSTFLYLNIIYAKKKNNLNLYYTHACYIQLVLYMSITKREIIGSIFSSQKCYLIIN